MSVAVKKKKKGSRVAPSSVRPLRCNKRNARWSVYVVRGRAITKKKCDAERGFVEQARDGCARCGAGTDSRPRGGGEDSVYTKCIHASFGLVMERGTAWHLYEAVRSPVYILL